MVLPERAVIIAETKNELISLMSFFDENGYQWPSKRPCLDVVDTLWGHRDIQQAGKIAVNLKNCRPDGYCYPNYYKHNTSYLNNIYPEWNFISVKDFITKLTGSYCGLDEIDYEHLL